MSAPALIRVWHVDPRNGWVAQQFDADETETDAEYSFHKADAVRNAKAAAGPDTKLEIFTKTGKLLGT